MRKIKNNLHSNTFQRTNTFLGNHSYEQFLLFMSYHLTIFWSPVELYLLTFSIPSSLYLSSDCLFHLECLVCFVFFLISPFSMCGIWGSFMKEVATHSGIIAWEIRWTQGSLVGPQRVGHFHWKTGTRSIWGPPRRSD